MDLAKSNLNKFRGTPEIIWPVFAASTLAALSFPIVRADDPPLLVDPIGRTSHVNGQSELQEKKCPVGLFAGTPLVPGGNPRQNSINLAKRILDRTDTILIVLPNPLPALVNAEDLSNDMQNPLYSVWVLGEVTPPGETFDLPTGDKNLPNVPTLLLTSRFGEGACHVATTHSGPEDYIGIVETQVGLASLYAIQQPQWKNIPFLTSRDLSNPKNHFAAPYLIVVRKIEDQQSLKKCHARFLGSADLTEIGVIAPHAVIGIRVPGEKGLAGHVYDDGPLGKVDSLRPVLIADSLDKPDELPGPKNVPWIAQLLEIAKWKLTWYWKPETLAR